MPSTTSTLSYDTFLSTSDAPVLSEEQRKDFARDGLLKVDHFFTSEEVELITKMAEDIEGAKEERGGIWKYWNMQKGLEEGKKFLDRLENFSDKHEGWNALFMNKNSRLVKAVSELFGPEAEGATLWKEKLNFKKPGSSGFAPHQDAQAGWNENGQTLHISVAVNIDETTIPNGCLEMVKGMHTKGLIGPVRDKMPEDVVNSMEWEFYPCPKHSIVFFDSFVPHRSEPNKTQSDRRVSLATFSKGNEDQLYSREKYFADKVLSCPPDAEKVEGKQYRGYII